MQDNMIAPPLPTPLADVIDRYAEPVREKLLALRAVILDVARDENVGAVEETLKWGQPSFLCKAGTTVRIDRDETHGGAIALYVNCKTSLVEEWRERFPELSFGGNRSLHITLEGDLGDARLRMCIANALTYRRRRAAKQTTA
ncbi:DUF1801 domain-containing protein [Rhizobium sp. KVB221]|uniref:DUF1801 domain-containing protein n=1 Tax=Rhizobium setariae TaxID=2801340 RepID=A0A936YRJ6_9HYPH|nr:DUF1801 domain-containing protein [Rhizobium setariae]MBL0371247.1 DUF1801 domain-containing protein [Rhizobium setariae]